MVIFYQTAIRQKRGRITKQTEQIDLVIGSATKGQTISIGGRMACSSFGVVLDGSPSLGQQARGYVDGSADFVAPAPRCPCHATSSSR